MKDDEQVTYFMKSFLCLRNQLMGVGFTFSEKKSPFKYYVSLF
jgi:hypothetical protein